MSWYVMVYCLYCCFFFSSRRRHTRCALVTGVQTCALPILSAGTRHNPTVIVSTESRRARNLVAGACRPARLPAVPARVAGGTGGARDRGRARVAARAVLPAGRPGRCVGDGRASVMERRWRAGEVWVVGMLLKQKKTTT